MKLKLNRFLSENKSTILLLLLMSVFRSAIADWSDVPTGSMQPTIVEGDRILINKMAYDIRLPFTHTSLYKISDPQRGDIAIFDSKVSDIRLVKRVIGVPGDTVALASNQLFINGKQARYDNLSEVEKIEWLDGKPHAIKLANIDTPLANFPPVTVPDNYYLVLGDNRNKSADSRVIGLVPRNEFVGRASSVVLSMNYDNYLLPRSERWFKALDPS